MGRRKRRLVSPHSPPPPTLPPQSALLLLAAAVTAVALNPVQRGPPENPTDPVALQPSSAPLPAAAPAPSPRTLQPDTTDAKPPPATSVYALETPVDVVARAAAQAVEAARARAARRRAAAAAADSDAVSDAAADPHPEEKPIWGPPIIRDGMATGVTASPMEIISNFQGRADGDGPLGPVTAAAADGGARIEAEAGGCTDIPKDNK